MQEIFLVVGTHPQPFDRLLEKMDELVGEGEVKEKVFAQIGCSAYEPKNFSWERLLNYEEQLKHFKNADLVVSHAGAGSIIDSLREKKPLVIVPRLKEFSEHTDSHQLDLAEALEGQGKCITVKDIEWLGEAIKKAASFKPKEADATQIVARIKGFLEAVEGKK